jgi:DeoR family transcriptional regulator, ulaG and ulaABCDEF operon transcriptional repressor
MAMLETERHESILNMLRREQFVRVTGLSVVLGASQATIRRDLDDLEARGLLVRVRGGARAADGIRAADAAPRERDGANQLQELPFTYRIGHLAAQKRAIAQAAASFCRDGDTIIMDGSSTVYPMVHFFGRLSLTVITTCFAVAEALADNPNIRVIVTGGVLYADSRLVYDPFSRGFYRNYGVTRVFKGAKGVSERGVSTSNAVLVSMDQEMIDTGAEVNLMVDSTKVGRQAELIVCGFERIRRIITDAGISPEAREMIGARGVELIVAGRE